MNFKIIQLFLKNKICLATLLFFLFSYIEKVYSFNVNSILDSSKFYSSTNFSKSLKFSNQALLLSEKIKSDSLIAKSYLLIGLANYLNGNQDEALKNYFLSKNIVEKTSNYKAICEVDNELGILYIKQKKINDAKSVLTKSIYYATKAKDISLIANACNNLGLVYNDSKQLDSAEYYFNIAYKKYDQIQSKLGMSYSLDYLSAVYVNTNRLELAEDKLYQSIKIKNELNDKTGEAVCINNLGELYLQKNELQKALIYFKAAADSSKKINYLDLEAYTYQMQADIYSKLNDYKNAYEYSNLYKQKNELLLNEKRIKAIEEYQTKYETEKKESEIKQQQLKINKRNTLLISLSVIFLLSLLAFYLLYNRYKLKQQTKLQQELFIEQQKRSEAVLEAEEMERQRIARDLHDGVGQLLSATKLNFNAITNDIILENKQTEEKLHKSISMIDDSIKEIRNISHNMMPATLQHFGIIKAIEEFTDRMNLAGKSNINFEYFEVDEDKLNSTFKLMLYRITQEIINNTIKHADASNINIQLIGDENELVLTIEDNGTGFDVQKAMKEEGIGLKNIQLRVDYLKGILNIDSTIGKGTTTIIEIPLS